MDLKNIPKIMYGTAWKEDATEELVLTAIKAGFRAIDTANQRRHYHEAAVGNAVAKSDIKREELFLQTKFTFLDSQDHRLPYDANAAVSTQVQQSFQSSLEHLQTTYIDSYVLHGPSTSYGLSEDDWDAWHAMELLHKNGLVKHLGISNVHLDQLKLLYEKAIVKPSFVQNRCYAQTGWDKEVRTFCLNNNIIYQGFSLLTANPFIVPDLQPLVEKYHKTPSQLIFRFSQQIGMLPLTGTTSLAHMKEDLLLDFILTPEEVKFIEDIV